MQNRIQYSSLLQNHLLFILLLFIITQNAFAHGGRTNAAGCHNNRKTGEYHCHGKPGTSPQTAPAKSTKDCGSKYYCREMSSCAEAMHYYKNCGLDRLDGDNDGVPCESICGHHK
jgi:hypothetical protein